MLPLVRSGCGSETCTHLCRPMRPARNYLRLSRIKWCPEKCSHLRLFLFREALELSQLSRRNWYARPSVELACLKHSPLKTACSACSTTGIWCGSSDLHREATGFKPVRSANSLQIRVWCQAPDLHREAVRFELTRYANSRQLGGTRGQTRTDRSQHRRLRRPSTGPSAGANWSGRTESNRPVPRWQRCRAPCAPA